MAAEDLLNHYKLDAHVAPPYTSHFTFKRDRVRGGRQQVETKWIRAERIGRGGFSEVWRETNDRPDGSQDVRAVKIIDKQQMRSVGVDYKKEILALAKFSKEEYREADVLVSFLGWFETEESVFFAMEYFELGTLAQHILDITTEDHVRQITIDLLEGLDIMHSESFAHRDLKPQNIFVVQKPPSSNRWCVKIGDFGISKRVKDGATVLHTQTGTPYFQAPEVVGFIKNDSKTSENSVAVDLWSLGCVLYYVSARRVPFSPIHQINEFCQGHIPFPDEHLSHILSESGRNLISCLLVPQPSQRMTIKQALKHPWILNPSRPDHQDQAFASLQQDITNGPDRNVNSITNEPHQQNDQDREARLDKNEALMLVSPTRTLHLVDTKIESSDSLISTDDAGKLENGGKSPQSKKKLSLEPVTRTNRASDTRVSLQTGIGTPFTPVSDENAQKDSESSVDLKPVNLPSSAESLAAMIPRRTKKTFSASGRTLSELSGVVTSVAYSANNQMIAAGSYDQMVHVWDATTSVKLCTLSNHTERIYAVAFSPDSKLVASGSGDQTIRVWDVTKKQLMYTLTGHRNWVYALAFSPDGTFLASGSYDMTIRLWDLTTKKEQFAFSGSEGHTQWVTAVAFSPVEALIASGSCDTTVKIWDIVTRRCRHTLRDHAEPVQAVAFSPDGSLIASGSYDKTIKVWNTATAQCLYTLSGHNNWVMTVVFTPDGMLIASGSRDRTIRIWDTVTGELRQTFRGHLSTVLSLSFSPDMTTMASGSGDKSIVIRDATEKKLATNPEQRRAEYRQIRRTG